MAAPRGTTGAAGSPAVACGGAVRWLRAAWVAAAVVGLGAGGHGAAGGAVPGPGTLLALSVVAAVAVRAGVPQRAGAVTLAAWLALGQLAVHEALVHLDAGHGHGAAPAVPAVPAGGAGGAPAPHGPLVDALASGWGMALAHVAAAVGAGLWLAAGERALWAVLELGVGRCALEGGPVRRALLLLRSAAVAAPVHDRSATRAGWVEPPVLVPCVSPRSRPRRGPPRLSCP